MDEIFREKLGDIFIQCKKMKSKYCAWSSEKSTDDPLDMTIDIVYFEFGDTKEEAMSKLKNELTKPCEK